MVTKLEQFKTNKEFNILPIITENILRTSCETLFGKSLPETEIKKFLREIKAALSKFGKTTKYLIPNLIFRDAEKFAVPEADIVETARNLIKENENEYFQRQNNRLDEDLLRKTDNLLDKIVQYKYTKDNSSNYDIGQNVMFTITAGLDSTSLTISNTLLLLAMHPEIQEKCYRELVSITSDEDIDADTLSRLEYLNMVVKESLRLLTIVPHIGRKLDCDIKTGDIENKIVLEIFT